MTDPDSRLQPLALPAAEDAHAWVEARARDGLAAAEALVTRLRDAPPTGDGAALATLRAWDEVSRALSGVAAPVSTSSRTSAGGWPRSTTG